MLNGNVLSNARRFGCLTARQAAVFALLIALALLTGGPAAAQTSSGGLPDVTLDVSVISLTERDDSTDVTVTATLASAAAADTTITLALDEDAPLLTPGVRSVATRGTDYTTTLDNGNNTITIAAGSASGQITFAIDPTYDTAVEGDEAIILTGTTDAGVVAPTDLIVEDGPYLAFPKYIYGHLSYPGEPVAITVEEAINKTASDSTVAYALTGTEPTDNPLELTFDPVTRQLTGTAPADDDVPDAGLTARYHITALDSAGRRATTMVSVAVVKDVCSSTNTTLFPAATHPMGQSAPRAELVKDCNVLLAAKETLQGSTGNLNWATGTAITSWNGLTEFHAPDSRNIRKIELYGHSLNGTIPPVLGHLAAPSSTDLVLGDDWRTSPADMRNKLTGPIPPELGLPPNMIVLALSRNDLTGPIPRELTNNGKLKFLYLHETDVSGPIPPEFGDLPMRGLSISGNPGVTGHIPWQLGKNVSTGDHPGLQVLNLYGNSLEGSIPWQLGRFGKIQQLGLTGNRLTGSIPWQLGNLGNEEADLERRIVYVFLNTNELSGPIPPQLGNIANLAILSLSKNRLTGSIPAELGGLSKLQYLYLRDNQLTGNVPSELGNLGVLRELFLSYNRLSGEIPAELGSLVNLESLTLSSNNLSGHIPTELGELTNVKELWLWGNELEGPIPDLRGMTSLIRLKLQSNRLTGGIPAWFGEMTNLRYLYLHHNQLGGEIPPELGNMTSLRYLWLHSNQLTGEIPEELGDLDNLWDLNLHSNSLDGTIPGELGGLSSLTHLRLHRNGLSGAIPVQLGNLSSLKFLWLHGNGLTGEIPSEFGGLSNLQRLYLSENRLSGEIPAALDSLADTLTHWRLADNRFTGCVPAKLAGVGDNDLDSLGLDVCK